MKENLKHHVVSFPDCRLAFDLPSELTPSTEFVMQRLDSAVDYATILWRTPLATEAFVSIVSDLRSGPRRKVAASLSVEMWLGAPPASFHGDVSHPSDLRRAYGERAVQTRNENADELLIEDFVDGRPWFYVRSANLYLTALNQRIFLIVRAAKVPSAASSDEARDWAQRGITVVLESMKIQPVTAAAQPVK